MKSITLSILFCFFTLSSFSQGITVDSFKQQRGFAIGPATLYFSVNRGETGKQIIQIVNKEDTTYQFHLSATEWELDSNGHSVHYIDSGNVSNSCASWVSFSKDVVQVPPNKVATVVVTLKAPDTEDAANKMHWCVVNVTMGAEKTAPKKITEKATVVLQKEFNLVLHLYQTPVGLNDKDLKMTGLTIWKDTENLIKKDSTDSETIIKISGKNTGNVSLRCQFSAKLSSLATGQSYSLKSVEGLVLPNGTRVANIHVPKNIPSGRYLIIASVDGGEDAPVEVAEKEIEI